MPYLRTLTADPRTWKELGWLGLTSIVGFGGGLVVTLAVGLVVVYVSVPLWYWAVSHPVTGYGVTELGPVTIDTLGKALVAAAVGLALIPVVLLLTRSFAKAHAGLAARILASERHGEQR